MTSFVIILITAVVFLSIGIAGSLLHDIRMVKFRQRQFKQTIELLARCTLPPAQPGQYILFVQDFDPGSIMAGRPDPAPQIISTFSEAMNLALEEADDMFIAILDSKKELICTVQNAVVTTEIKA